VKALRDGVPAFLAFEGGGDAGLGAAMMMASDVANDAVESMSFVVGEEEETWTFLGLLVTAAEAASLFLFKFGRLLL
jgi:hypothetical protein